MSLNKLKQLLKTSTPFMFNVIEHTLSYRDYVIVRHDKFLLGVPKSNPLPVMLVAHIDTVHKEPPPVVYHDQDHGVLWSPYGLGADDRAGVYALLSLSKQHKPYLLFTDEEESGGGGAHNFLDIYPKAFADIKMIIQLDRRGIKDSVYYDNDSDDFQAYIDSFGFATEMGTFSDISIICPEWEVNGVNLSVGYFNEHRKEEFLVLSFLHETIKKVSTILSQDIPKYEYKEYISLYRGYWNNTVSYSSRKECDMCGYLSHELIVFEDGFHVCEECFSITMYECESCGEIIQYDTCDNINAEDNGYCDECWKEFMEGDEQSKLYPLKGEN